MGPVEELKLHTDAICSAIKAEPKFFASVSHYALQLKQLLTGTKVPQVEELRLLVSKLEEFWAQWRSTGGGFYNPPRATADTDSTVLRMQALVGVLAAMPAKEFQQAASVIAETAPKGRAQKAAPRVFIGHGRSRLWARVKLFLEGELGLATVAYESESRAGDSIIPILEGMMEEASFAVLILTAEDEGAGGSKRARQNVIHEAGLFQGRLGFRRAVLLIQDGIEEFSNVAGLQHLKFAGENVEQTFYELQRVLKREGQIGR